MDNRTFSDDRDASARMTSTMKLTFTGGSLSANSSHKTDPTHKLWCKDGSDREAPREAKRDNMHFGNPVQADGVIQFTVGGRANNPFVPASPSIYYAGTFLLRKRRRGVDAQILSKIPASCAQLASIAAR
jgi:hypothetical protein